MKDLKKLKKWWFITSFVYLCLVVFDFCAIYPNEEERPERDRHYATVELVEYSYKLQRLNSIVDMVDQMIENDLAEWRIVEHFIAGCKEIESDVKILKSDKSIQAKYSDQTLLEYDTEASFINLTEKEIPSKKYFSLFPNLIDIHILYKKVDHDARVLELHENYKNLDFTPIEDEYHKNLVWILPRFIIFGLIVWFVPVSIGALIIKFLSRK